MRQRIPLAKAEATGRTKVNPARFKDRKEPQSKRLGKPSSTLNRKEVQAWHCFVYEAPWLVESDRALLEVACILRVKHHATKRGSLNETGAFLRVLSKLGMTPVDRSRVMVTDGNDNETSAAEAYLN
jgi:hypothetical protein